MSDLLASEMKNKIGSNHPVGTPQLQDFIEALFTNSDSEYASFSFPVDTVDPLAFLDQNWQENQFHYYWEKPSDEFAIAAGETLHSLTSASRKRFGEINSQITRLKNETAEFSEASHSLSGMMFFGGFSFFDNVSGNYWQAFPPASFTVPKWIIIRHRARHFVTLTADISTFTDARELYNDIINRLERVEQDIQTGFSISKPLQPSTNTSLSLDRELEYDRWCASVTKAKKLISKNAFDKIVIARKLTTQREDAVAPARTLNILRQRYQSCYNFLVHQPSGNTFLGSTPERLGSFQNNVLLTEALAGSIKRGANPQEDSWLANNLSASPKNRNEHNFVVQDIEERLQDYVKSVKRDDHPEIKKLLNVQHLYTPIKATLSQGMDPLTIVEQLHPTPAVGGYPWDKAKPYLKELEHFERGWYAGPVGWLNSNGSGEFAVGIRSGLLTKDEAHFFAGCGIVADSDPATEWNETNLKLKPMLSALQYD